MVKSRVSLGMGDLPPLVGNPYNWYINPYYWVDEFIPYYMEMMGVDRPDRTYTPSTRWSQKPTSYKWGELYISY